jgi:hypothetical protein
MNSESAETVSRPRYRPANILVITLTRPSASTDLKPLTVQRYTECVMLSVCHNVPGPHLLMQEPSSWRYFLSRTLRATSNMSGDPLEAEQAIMSPRCSML